MRLPQTVTIWLVAVTGVASLLILGAGLNAMAMATMGFIPARFSGLVQVGGAVPAILTPLTATLVHGGLLHLGFNLLMLAWCGVAVERVLGGKGVLVIYGVSAYVAMLAQWVVGPAELAPVIGASGAVSGLIGAYALSFGRAKQVSSSPAVNRLVNIVWLAVAWAVLQWAVGFSAGAQGVMLATPAHVGGFVAGMLLQRPLLLWRYRGA